MSTSTRARTDAIMRTTIGGARGRVKRKAVRCRRLMTGPRRARWIPGNEKCAAVPPISFV
jgi:hypothetical protein